MRKQLMVAVVLALGLAAPAARAEDLFCKGTIDRLYVDASSDVYVLPSWRNDWIQICNLDNASKNISPKVCSVWVSLAMAAHTTRKTTTMLYEGTTLTCATLPTYTSAPRLTYLLLEKQ